MTNYSKQSSFHNSASIIMVTSGGIAKQKAVVPAAWQIYYTVVPWVTVSVSRKGLITGWLIGVGWEDMYLSLTFCSCQWKILAGFICVICFCVWIWTRSSEGARFSTSSCLSHCISRNKLSMHACFGLNNSIGWIPWRTCTACLTLISSVLSRAVNFAF